MSGIDPSMTLALFFEVANQVSMGKLGKNFST